MKNILLIAFLIIGIKGYSQSKMLYIVPDSVEVVLERKIVILKERSRNTFFYFLLSKDSTNTYSLSLFPAKNKEEAVIGNKKLIRTNKALLINNTQYPLLLDYDFIFGTDKENQVGELGYREGNVVRSTVLFHGFTIYFNREGKIIKTANY